MTIAHGSTVAEVTGSGTTIACGSYNQAAGEHINVKIAIEDAASVAPTGVSDTAGNTYVAGTFSGDSQQGCQIWYCVAPCKGNASNVITATFAASKGFLCMVVERKTTTTGVTAFKAQPAAASGNSASPLTAAFNAGDFAESINKNFSGSTATPNAGWTERTDTGGSTGTATDDRIDSPGGTYTAGMTITSAPWTLAAMSFTETIAAGGARKPPGSDPILGPTGGVPMAYSPLATPGLAPSYGAVRWQNWEAYPWGGIAAVITQFFGADVVAAIEAALLTGAGAVSGADVAGSVDAANVGGAGALSGADIVGAIEGGKLTAVGAVSAADFVAAIEGGLVTGAGAVAAADIVAAIEAASVTGAGALSGADVVGAIEGVFLDIFVVLTQFSGADVVGVVDAANLAGSGLLAGADVVGAVDTAALIASGAISAADVVAAIEAANLTALASGTRKLRVIGSVIVRRLH
jgi:hypothetical protein